MHAHTMDHRPRRTVAGGLLPTRRRTKRPQFQTPPAYARRTETALSTTPTLAPPPLPSHWAVPSNPVLASLFSGFCLVAVGKPHLKDVWSDCNYSPESVTKEEDEGGCPRCGCYGRPKEDPFQATQERWKDKFTTVTVVAGLILSATAALCTTTPSVPGVLNYTVLAPYYLLLMSLVVSLGGLIVGSSVIYMFSNAIDPVYFRRRLLSNRRKVICFLIIMGYPFASIGVSTISTALGLYIAAWVTPDVLVRIGSTFGLSLPISLAFGVMYMQSGKDLEEEPLPLVQMGMNEALPPISTEPETYDVDTSGKDDIEASIQTVPY